MAEYELTWTNVVYKSYSLVVEAESEEAAKLKVFDIDYAEEDVELIGESVSDTLDVSAVRVDDAN